MTALERQNVRIVRTLERFRGLILSTLHFQSPTGPSADSRRAPARTKPEPGPAPDGDGREGAPVGGRRGGEVIGRE